MPELDAEFFYLGPDSVKSNKLLNFFQDCIFKLHMSNFNDALIAMAFLEWNFVKGLFIKLNFVKWDPFY